MKPVDSLHGWKEIAAYLGKSVRAAQRWEQELGLPIHRVRTAAGHAIYARPDEIDRWLVDQEPESAAPATPIPDAENESSPGAKELGRGWGTRVALAIAGITTLAVASIMLADGSWSDRDDPGQPTFALVHDSLVATEVSGAELWRYQFPHRLGDQPEGRGGADPPAASRIRRADVDGDGVQEILAMVRFTAPSYPSDALYCFSADGTMLWSYQPEQTLDFAGVSYKSPWLLTDWIVGGAGEERALYVAVNHHMWWPSMIVRISTLGKTERIYTQSGGAYALLWWTASDRPYLLAAGINNEYEAATLAILDPAAGEASSPQTPGSGYHCSTCSTRGPEAYFVFPKSDVTLASGSPYNRANGLAFAPSGVRVLVQEDIREPDALRVFSLSAHLQAESTVPVDFFWSHHERLARENQLDHSIAVCPHRTLPTVIRHWDRTHGWRSVEVSSSAPRLVSHR